MLLLIANRKSYTGSRLLPNLMTIDNHERQNRGFYRVFAILAARHISRANFAEFATDRQGQAAH